MFYLKCRGIPDGEARRLIVRGFFNEVLNRIPVENVREELINRVSGELENVDRALPQQVTRGDVPVAAVVALTAQDENSLSVRKAAPGRVGDGVTGFFHEKQEGNACLSRSRVGGPHLRGGKEVHGLVYVLPVRHASTDAFMDAETLKLGRSEVSLFARAEFRPPCSE